MAGNKKKSHATSLWQRRVKVAMPKAKQALKTTAYALLDESGQKVIEDAIDKILEVEIARAVEDLPPGERLDYDPMIKEAIVEVFTDHFELFNWDVSHDADLQGLQGWDDESCPHELFDIHGT
ncbi:hypothetical protein TruAng_000582 [Truncatella angustata]|nr:hypothetical protein TruAng_000582 [Truncatella angustata]